MSSPSTSVGSALPTILYQIPSNVFAAVGLPLVLGLSSGYTTASVVKGPWYKGLLTPAYAPPRQAFGIVWPILYVGMGYASHLIVKAHASALTPAAKNTASLALTLYYLQLAGNLTWTPLFFGLKQTGLALVDIVALTATVFALTITADSLPTEISTTWFLGPYCAWLSYATYLNAGYWFLNYSPWAATKGKSL
ncbi:TspO/MBR-related protein [Mrakia frigida]|uniref:TspO/MBR family protein n=1 Tax=Mrakia frigida TaxID=29902 RepID=UPI003FCBF060